MQESAVFATSVSNHMYRFHALQGSPLLDPARSPASGEQSIPLGMTSAVFHYDDDPAFCTTYVSMTLTRSAQYRKRMATAADLQLALPALRANEIFRITTPGHRSQ